MFQNTDMPFNFENTAEEVPTSSATAFQLSAGPNTDICCKPDLNVFNAPVLYRSMPLSVFRSGRTTVTANWKAAYDQGGLILVLPQLDGSKKWVKSGIEVLDGKLFASTVAADRSADGSVTPVESGTATIEFEREVTNSHLGSSLWVYLVDKTGRRPLKEVTWAFEESEFDRVCWFGIYAARPTFLKEDPSQVLEVSFTDFELK